MHSHQKVINKEALIEYAQSSTQGVVRFKVPNARYGDELLKLKCAPDLIALGIWPNWKEVTEAFGCWRAIRKHVPVDPGDSTVTVYVVGDGRTPRLGALIAHMSRWTVYSIDPIINLKECYKKVRRLTLIRGKIQDVHQVAPGSAVIALPHAHVDANVALQAIEAPNRHLVAIPCCVDLQLPTAPTVEYADWGIWSPERVVRVWCNV